MISFHVPTILSSLSLSLSITQTHTHTHSLSLSLSISLSLSLSLIPYLSRTHSLSLSFSLSFFLSLSLLFSSFKYLLNISILGLACCPSSFPTSSFGKTWRRRVFQFDRQRLFNRRKFWATLQKVKKNSQDSLRIIFILFFLISFLFSLCICKLLHHFYFTSILSIISSGYFNLHTFSYVNFI